MAGVPGSARRAGASPAGAYPSAPPLKALPLPASRMPSPRPVPRALLRASLVVAALRLLVPVAALPLVAVLIPDRVPLLLLLRPGREVVLLGGGLHRVTGDPTVTGLLLAYLPLMTLGVWAFFVVGRAYGPQLRDGTGPGWLQRAVPQDRLLLASRVLTRRGPAIAVLGRIAWLPPVLLAAAAGTSRVRTVTYLAADLLGAGLTFFIALGVGFALGDAYARGGAWLTGAGLGLLLALLWVLSRWVQREAARGELDGPALDLDGGSGPPPTQR